MCEKPISVDVITSEDFLAKAASKPHLKFLVPFFADMSDTVGFLQAFAVRYRLTLL